MLFEFGCVADLMGVDDQFMVLYCSATFKVLVSNKLVIKSLINFCCLCWNTHRNKSKWSSAMIAYASMRTNILIQVNVTLKSSSRVHFLNMKDFISCKAIFTEFIKFIINHWKNFSFSNRRVLLLLFSWTWSRNEMKVHYLICAQSIAHLRHKLWECMQQSISCRRNEQNRAATATWKFFFFIFCLTTSLNIFTWLCVFVHLIC